MLGGFFRILRLENLFAFNTPAGETLDRLRLLQSYCGPAIQEITACTELLIGDAAMSAYR